MNPLHHKLDIYDGYAVGAVLIIPETPLGLATHPQNNWQATIITARFLHLALKERGLFDGTKQPAAGVVDCPVLHCGPLNQSRYLVIVNNLAAGLAGLKAGFDQIMLGEPFSRVGYYDQLEEVWRPHPESSEPFDPTPNDEETAVQMGYFQNLRTRFGISQ